MTIQGRGRSWNAVTEADGTFFLSSLAAGDYVVHGDEDSLPPGYAADTLGEPQPVMVMASSPGKAAFTVRAFRSISGRVLTYAPKAGGYVPVNGAQVLLRETGMTARTDLMGRYLFRDLAAGRYTVSVQAEGQPSALSVALGARPVDTINVDFQIDGTRPPVVTSVDPLPLIGP